MLFFESQVAERTRVITAWVLIVGFLCQPILTYLVTPMQVTDRQGFTAVMCTLQGTKKEIFIELPSIDGEQVAAEDCSAIKLIQLAGTTQVSQPVELSEVFLYAVGLVDQTADHQHHALHFSAYSSRAPPLV